MNMSVSAVSEVCVASSICHYIPSQIRWKYNGKLVAKYVAYVDDNFVAKYVQNMMTIIMKIMYRTAMHCSSSAIKYVAKYDVKYDCDWFMKLHLGNMWIHKFMFFNAMRISYAIIYTAKSSYVIQPFDMRRCCSRLVFGL